MERMQLLPIFWDHFTKQTMTWLHWYCLHTDDLPFCEFINRKYIIACIQLIFSFIFSLPCLATSFLQTSRWDFLQNSNKIKFASNYYSVLQHTHIVAFTIKGSMSQTHKLSGEWNWCNVSYMPYRNMSVIYLLWGNSSMSSSCFYFLYIDTMQWNVWQYVHDKAGQEHFVETSKSFFLIFDSILVYQ